MSGWIVALALTGAMSAPAPQKLHITVRADKQVNFAALHSYAWAPRWTAFAPAVDERIVAAINRELTSLGLTRRIGPPVDVLVGYGSVPRTNVDLDGAVGTSGRYPEYPVGTLVVVLMEPGSRREWFRARAVAPVDPDPTHVDQAIDMIISRIFAHYPTRD